MAELSELRKKIDSIDEELVKLLDERAALVLEVKAAKKESNTDIYSPSREKEIRERVQSLAAESSFPKHALDKIFTSIVSATRSLIGDISVGVPGPLSGASYNAAVNQFGEDVSFKAEPSVAAVFEKVESGELDYGVVPIETSGSGIVNETFKTFISADIKIVAEILIPNSLALFSQTTDISEVNLVLGDAKSFAETSIWFSKNLPNVKREVVSDLSAGLESAKQNSKSAIVFPLQSEKVIGLNLLADRINDSPEGKARFLVLGTQTPTSGSNDKTTLLCAVEERAGALFDVLRFFAERNVTLSKIESKPLPEAKWEHVFFIDLLGNKDDKNLAESIDELRDNCRFLKVLGSYPQAVKSN